MVNFVNKFNDNPSGILVSDEVIAFDGMNIVHSFLHNNVMEAKGIELWTGTGKTGTKITDYTVTQNVAKPWVYELTFGVSVAAATYYLTYYSSGDLSDADTINDIQNKIINISKVMVDIKDFGAVGNDAADDAPFIQAALDGKGRIYAPEGVYSLGSSLTIKSNTHLTLHPNAVFKRRHNDILLTNYDDVSTGYNGQGNIIIEGGILDVNGDEYPDVANGISFAHGHDIVVRDTTLLNTPLGHAMEITGSIRVLVDNVAFLGYRTDASNNNYYVEAIQIEPTLPPPVGETYTYPYVTDSTPSKDITVRNCWFGPSANYPTYPCGVGAHGVKYGLWYDNIRVMDNTFDGCTYWAIRPFKWRNSIISRNVIKNGVASGAGTGAGIYVTIPASGASIEDINGVPQTAQGTDTLVISDNVIHDMNGKGIYVQGGNATARISQVVIKGNTLKNITGYGIQCEYVDRMVVADNILEDITGRALSLLNVINSQYENNNVHLITDNCAFITASQYVQFSGNILDNIKYYGFNISGDNKNLYLVGNIIKNPSQLTNGQYDGIIISTGADNIQIVANKVRHETGLNAPRYGLNIQTGVTNIVRYGNDFRCDAVTNSLSDLSTTPVTTSADVV